jgi:CrcB protein
MRAMLLVALGGALGAVMRYAVSGWVQALSRDPTFPLGTLAVNVLGCFVIGGLAWLAGERNLLAPDTRLLVQVGFLGAFTTFSSFSNETLALLRGGEGLRALLNVGANNLLCLLATGLGYGLPGLLWR